VKTNNKKFNQDAKICSKKVDNAQNVKPADFCTKVIATISYVDVKIIFQTKYAFRASLDTH
jgi:hypothetical protein